MTAENNTGNNPEGFRWISLGDFAKAEDTTLENALVIANNAGHEVRKKARGYQVFTDIALREKRTRKKQTETKLPKPGVFIKVVDATKPIAAPQANETEVRVVNEKTGGEKGTKILRYDLVPWEPMQEVAKLFGWGAQKYAANNWALGYDWSLSYAAAMRHLTAFWLGESHHEVIDGEPASECHHLAAVVFHALALMYFEKHHPDLDDRQLSLFDADETA